MNGKATQPRKFFQVLNPCIYPTRCESFQSSFVPYPYIYLLLYCFPDHYLHATTLHTKKYVSFAKYSTRLNNHEYFIFATTKKQIMLTFKHATKSIELIEHFMTQIDEGVLVFQEGVKNYLSENHQNFTDNLRSLSNLETEADIAKRKIENLLYTRSLMPQLRGDIMRLLEDLDNIIDLAKTSLYQFDVEVPYIPAELHPEFIKLTEVNVAAVETVIPAARAYFRDPESIKEKIHRVYFYEKEVDKIAMSIKRKAFQEMTNLKLSEKFHLRYFTLHIETLSDAAEKVADLLSIMAIKRTM